MRLRDALFAEFLGTLLLLLVTVGSQLTASHAAAADEFPVLAANALATGFGISALILSLNPVSGACFNPLAAVLLCMEGEIKRRYLPGYLLSQFLGALLGTLLVHYLFRLPVLQLAHGEGTGLPMAVSEFIGALGLLLVIHRVGNTRSQWVAYAVGGYLLAGTWALPSHCLANPALTFARMFTDTYAGVPPPQAGTFLLAQALALAAIVVFIKVHKRYASLGD